MHRTPRGKAKKGPPLNAHQMIIPAIRRIEREAEKSTWHPLRPQYEALITYATFRRKRRWEPFSRFSTTISYRSIDLAHDWDTWSEADQASNLLHEAQHIIQRRESGRPIALASKIWTAHYLASREFRYDMELEALRVNARWWGLISENEFMNFISGRYVSFETIITTWAEKVVSHFASNYFMGDWFDETRKKLMFSTLVRVGNEAYSKRNAFG